MLQMYQGTGRTDAPAPVAMYVQILDGAGRALRDQSLTCPASAFANRRAGCVIDLPPATLAPGAYLLRLDASANRLTFGRAVPFVVE